MKNTQLKEDAPANAGGAGIAQGGAGASKDTVAGLDKPLKPSIAKRKSFKNYIKTTT